MTFFFSQGQNKKFGTTITELELGVLLEWGPVLLSGKRGVRLITRPIDQDRQDALEVSKKNSGD
jgi:hypothetical protein